MSRRKQQKPQHILNENGEVCVNSAVAELVVSELSTEGAEDGRMSVSVCNETTSPQSTQPPPPSEPKQPLPDLPTSQTNTPPRHPTSQSKFTLPLFTSRNGTVATSAAAASSEARTPEEERCGYGSLQTPTGRTEYSPASSSSSSGGVNQHALDLAAQPAAIRQTSGSPSTTSGIRQTSGSPSTSQVPSAFPTSFSQYFNYFKSHPSSATSPSPVSAASSSSGSTTWPNLFNTGAMLQAQKRIMRNTCHYCGAVKSGPADLQRHLRKHTGERPFVCQMCNKAFKAKRSLQYHQFMHHGIEHKDTNICERFSEARKRKVQHDVPIGMDGKKMASYYDMFNSKMNMLGVYPFLASSMYMQPMETGSVHTGLGGIDRKPDVSQLQAENAAAAVAMSAWHHGKLAQSDIDMDGDPEGKEDLKYSSDSNNNDTTQDGDSKSDCDGPPTLIAEKPVGEDEVNEEEREEARVHTSHLISPDAPALCSNSPPLPMQLRREDKIDDEEDEDDFKGACLIETNGLDCHVCHKSFTKLSQLDGHLKMHTRERKFRCMICSRRFRLRSNLLYHQRLVHNMSVFGNSMKGKLTMSDCQMGLVQEHEERDNNRNDGENPQDGGADGKSQPQHSGGSSVSPQSSLGDGGARDLADHDAHNQDDFTIIYPSQFPGLKQRIRVKNETVLVTRLDGEDLVNKGKMSLYKCHMCGRIFNYMSKLQCHLSLHFERQMTLYQCWYCDSNFIFKTRLIRHMGEAHGVDVVPRPGVQSVNFQDENSNDDYEDEDEEAAENDNEDNESSPEQNKQKKKKNVPASSTITEVSCPDEAEMQDRDMSTTKVLTNCESLRGAIDNIITANYANLSQASPTSTATPSTKPRQKPRYNRVNGLYVCRFCNKSFDRLFSVHRHERVHTGFKPCYCRYCGRGFSEPRNLRHHVIRFHSDGSQLHLIKRNRKGQFINDDGDSCSLPPQLSPSMEKDDILPHSAADRPPSDESPPNHVRTTNKKELTPEFSQKLGEDVTVVIPSDAPISAKDGKMSPPPSNVSDTGSWSGNVSDAETECSLGNEIVSAPVTSIMTHKQAAGKGRRRSSVTGQSPPADDLPIDVKVEVKREETDEDKPLALLSPPALSASTVTTTTDLLQTTSSSLAAFSPLNVSLMSHGALSGFLPSPLISPVNQPPFYGQPPLASPTIPSLIPSALPYLTSLHNHASMPAISIPTTRPSTPGKESPTPSTSADLEKEEPGEVPWMKGPPRGSSLSRTHSRSNPGVGGMDARNLRPLGSLKDESGGSSSTSSRLYVVRQPLKREDACKPMVLPDGRTVYRCLYCRKDFTTYSDVNRHMDFHEDIRPYKCNFCDYYARTNSQLKVHMMRHQGIREFHCKLCNYKGVTQSDLNRHMKSQIHMMKAQNECRHCGEGFVSPKNLEKHYQEKHFAQYEALARQHSK